MFSWDVYILCFVFLMLPGEALDPDVKVPSSCCPVQFLCTNILLNPHFLPMECVSSICIYIFK